MNRFVRLLAAVALLAGAGSASAFTRITTTRRDGASQAADPGLLLWWKNRQITFHVNAAGTDATGCTAQQAEDTVAAALTGSWPNATRPGEASACTDVSFVHGSATTQIAMGKDNVNLVVFRKGACKYIPEIAADPCQLTEGACTAKYNCWEHDLNVRGLTTTTYDSASGEILDADVELFAWNGAQPYGAYFTCTTSSTTCTPNPVTSGARPTTDCVSMDAGAVATHESGHMLGLDHVCTSTVAPYTTCPSGQSPVMTPLVGDLSHRVLTADDVEGVCTIYPKGAETSASPGVDTSGKSGGSSGGGGCNTGGGAGVLALLGAAAAAWRSRRRR